MKRYQTIVCIAFLVIPFYSFCQSNHQYTQILATKAIGKTFIYSSKTDTSWVTYLGKINHYDKAVKFYVVKEFSKYKAAIIWHGHSRVYFFNSSKKLVAMFDVAMPEFLPDELVDNSLIFRYQELGRIKTYKAPIDSKLPPVICMRPNRCDEVVQLK